MTIDKWLDVEKSREKREEIDKKYNSLTEEQILHLKKKKIHELTKKRVKNEDSNDIINEIMSFKDWLNKRTYLKGDLDKVATYISNLNKKFALEHQLISPAMLKEEKKDLMEEFKKIPLTLLEEKTRLALNKKLLGTQMTRSDVYYLNKLKKTIEERLTEANYYEILKKIIEF